MTDTSPRPAAAPRARRSTARRSISLAPDLLAETPPSTPPPAEESAPAPKKPRSRKPATAAAAPEPSAPVVKPKPASRTKTATRASAAKGKSPAVAEPAPAEETATPAPASAGKSSSLNPDAKPGEEYPGEPVMKLTVNVPESLHRRASGIVAHAQFTGTPEGIRSLTDLLRDALNDAVTDMERRYNDGEPFKAPAALRRGRRPSLY